MNLIDEDPQNLAVFLPSLLEQHSDAQQVALEAEQTALEAQHAALEAQHAALEAQHAALEANNNLVWGTVGFGITIEAFYNTLKKLIRDIENGNFINYSQQEYISIASIIINSRNSNILNEEVNDLIKVLYKNISNKTKNLDKQVTKLSDEIVEKIDTKRVHVIDGKKTLLFMPQLERQCNWSYSLLSNEFVNKLGNYRELLRSKYYMICQYIEDLLIRKLKIQVETIKLELTLRGHFHLPLLICIQCNLIKMNEIKIEVEKLVKLMDKRILMDKERHFQIWEDWWTGSHERKICPLFTEFVDKDKLTFGYRWL